MMKKNYIAPTMRTHTIQPSAIICGSGGTNETLNLSSGGPGPIIVDNTITCDTKGQSIWDNEW